MAEQRLKQIPVPEGPLTSQEAIKLARRALRLSDKWQREIKARGLGEAPNPSRDCAGRDCVTEVTGERYGSPVYEQVSCIWLVMVRLRATKGRLSDRARAEMEASARPLP